ncbi:chromo domain-containing protein [Trichonephila clavata]|uniref:Chromo domain-containing protein n=1 Tax=Trichonephila clavata TaxID=2740835 RepID=A0A8X6HZU3_TRICU|nr:chromo domain-containing protein [Trichonephila clavata]
MSKRMAVVPGELATSYFSKTPDAGLHDIERWSDEVFRVTKVYFSHPTTFELQDLKSEAIKGRFYAEELQKISKRSDDYWRIEKVLKTKGIGRKKEYYVKWQGLMSALIRGLRKHG